MQKFYDGIISNDIMKDIKIFKTIFGAYLLIWLQFQILNDRNIPNFSIQLTRRIEVWQAVTANEISIQYIKIGLGINGS